LRFDFFKFSVVQIYFVFILGLCFSAEPVFVPQTPAKPRSYCSAYAKWISFVENDTSYVEISHYPYVKLDLRYASSHNITGLDLYCGARKAFLKRAAAIKLKRAVSLLQKECPGCSFVIFDASRPLYAQRKLREIVAGTPFSDYVSNPKRGSVHNFGYALDLSIADSSGALLDMGTDFDSFESRAGSRGESDALKEGSLTSVEIANRNLLRYIMKKSGFIPLSSEWWHFNSIPSRQIREIGELPPF